MKTNITLEIFSRRLRQLREKSHLTTKQLGEIVGVSDATISRYETRKRNPDLLVAHDLAVYFGVTIEYLCGEDTGTDVETLIEMYTKLSKESKLDAVKYVTYLYEKGE
jgi:transcriptional regulator with XRE-family HTH domain